MMLAFAVMLVCATGSDSASFYVAPHGNDDWSGTLAKPNMDSTDGPLATMARAQQAVRDTKAAEGLRGPITVLFRGGQYLFKDGIVLNEGDGGSREFPITYSAYPSETPVFSGGLLLPDWRPFEGQVLRHDLPGAKGGRWQFRQLFVDGERLPEPVASAADVSAPGAWFLDTLDGAVFLWPPDGALGDLEVIAPWVVTLVHLARVSWVSISGITFTATRAAGHDSLRDGGEGYGPYAHRPHQGQDYCGEAMLLRGAKHCTIEQNRFVNVGGNGIYLQDGCERNVVRRNEIAHAGGNGIVLLGNRVSHPVYNRIEANELSDCGVFPRPGWQEWPVGVFLGMSDGNVIAHNEIHDMPDYGINLGVNGHGRNIVEFNAIRRVCLRRSDNAGINVWMDVPRQWITGVFPETPRSGHIIRYNLITDVVGMRRDRDGKVHSPVPYNAMGIYLDDYTSNCFVYGNVIVRASTGITVHAGRNNIIENNVFVDCKWQHSLRDYASGRPGNETMAGTMTGNRYTRNIFYTSDPESLIYLLQAWTERSIGESDDNLYFCASGEYRIGIRTHDQDVWGFNPPYFRDVAYKTLEEWRGMGYDEHSITADPLFADPDNDDFRLSPESPAFRLGFQRIPLGKIGIPRDE